ncbi:MAG: IS66 family insertion sequence element accessory protein TnpA [Oscillibacter sp.]
MTSAELQHRAELQEWAAQIQECRSSGLSVSEWCRQQGVTTTLLVSFSGIPLSFAEAQILPSKKTVKMLRSGLKK